MQFTTAVVATANSDYLLANMFLGHPSVKDGSAEGLAQLICDEVQRHGIQPGQIEGFTPGGSLALVFFDNFLVIFYQMGSTSSGRSPPCCRINLALAPISGPVGTRFTGIIEIFSHLFF